MRYRIIIVLLAISVITKGQEPMKVNVLKSASKDEVIIPDNDIKNHKELIGALWEK